TLRQTIGQKRRIFGHRGIVNGRFLRQEGAVEEPEALPMKLSRRGAVEPFHAMDVLAEATKRRAAGRPVISMAVGQPVHPAPQAAREAARRALEIGRIGYTDALGLLSLRSAISDFYRNRHGVSVDPGRIAITTGPSAGFNLAFLALFDAGDRVAIARPGYPAYRNLLAALGIRTAEAEVRAANATTPTPQAPEAAAAAQGRTAGRLLASPANPTGTVTGRAHLAALSAYCRESGSACISDEICHGLPCVGEEATALEFGDEAVIINSFSKYYCMTGW